MSERMRCVVANPRTENISAMAIVVMAKTTMSWSVKSTVSIMASNYCVIAARAISSVPRDFERCHHTSLLAKEWCCNELLHRNGTLMTEFSTACRWHGPRRDSAIIGPCRCSEVHSAYCNQMRTHLALNKDCPLAKIASWDEISRPSQSQCYRGGHANMRNLRERLRQGVPGNHEWQHPHIR